MQGAHQHNSDNLVSVNALGFTCTGSPAVILIAGLSQALQNTCETCCVIAIDSLWETMPKEL